MCYIQLLSADDSMFAQAPVRPDGPPAVQKGACVGHAYGSSESIIVRQSSTVADILCFESKMLRVRFCERALLRRLTSCAGKHAYIGIGFRQRGDAFDFNMTLQEHEKYVSYGFCRYSFASSHTTLTTCACHLHALCRDVDRERSGVKVDYGPEEDFSLNPGESLKLNIKAVGVRMHGLRGGRVCGSQVNNGGNGDQRAMGPKLGHGTGPRKPLVACALIVNVASYIRLHKFLGWGFPPRQALDSALLVAIRVTSRCSLHACAQKSKTSTKSSSAGSGGLKKLAPPPAAGGKRKGTCIVVDRLLPHQHGSGLIPPPTARATGSSGDDLLGLASGMSDMGIERSAAPAPAPAPAPASGDWVSF